MKKTRPGMTVEESRTYNKIAAAEQRKRDPEYYKRWREAHPERNRSRYRKYRYGLSYQDFLALFAHQQGKCACCDTELHIDLLKHDRKRSPCVDHDHTTGEVRGLLCNGCNSGLGLFDESVAKLQRAIKYLQQHKGDKP